MIRHACLAALSLLAATGRAQEPAPARGLLELLPAETLAFVGSDDLRGLFAAIQDTPTGRMHASPEFEVFMGAMVRELDRKLREVLPDIQLGLASAETWLPGPCALALLDLVPSTEAGKSPGGSLALLADVSRRRDQVLDFLVRSTAVAKGVVLSRHSEGETEIFALRDDAPSDQRPPMQMDVALHAGMLLVTLDFGVPRDNWLGRLEQALEGRAGNPLSSRADVLASPAGAGGASLRAWIDLDRLGPAFAQLMEDHEEDFDDGREALVVVGKLGFNKVRALAARLDCNGGVLRGTVRLDWPAGSPLRDALASFLAGSSRPSLLALAPERPLAAFQLAAAWEDAFDAILRCILVGADLRPAELSAMLAARRDDLGFDLRDDLLARLDGRVAVVVADVPFEESLPPAESGSRFGSRNLLLTLGVSDAAGLLELIEALLRRTGLHAARQRTQLLGYELCHVPFVPGLAIHYALLPDRLVLSPSATLVQDAVRRAAAPELPALTSRPDVAAGLAALPTHPGFVAYTDLVEMQLLDQSPEPAQEWLPALGAGPSDGAVDELWQAARTAALAYPVADRALLERCFTAPGLGAVWADETGFTWTFSGP